MLRFVVLRHEVPPDYERPSHWDLMLEHAGALRTWAILSPPGVSQKAERLADHRLAYLDYEGPVSGNRGTVHRWDEGTYDVESETESEIVVRLSGVRLKGRLTLTRVEVSATWNVEYGEPRAE